MARLDIRYYPTPEASEVWQTFIRMSLDPNRSGAATRLQADIVVLADSWPRTLNVDVRILKGWEPLREIRRAHHGIEYRIVFVTRGRELWLLSIFEKRSEKTPRTELEKAYARMRNVLSEGS